MTSFEGQLARSLAQSFGWRTNQMSSFQGHLAKSLAPSFGWRTHQTSSFEGQLAKSLAPRSGWSDYQMSSFEGQLAMPLAPSFGWRTAQMSSFEGQWARSLSPSFGWRTHQRSSFEDRLVESLSPRSGWSHDRMSRSEGYLAISPAPSSGWTAHQMSRFQVSVGGCTNIRHLVQSSAVSVLVLHSHQHCLGHSHSTKHHTRLWVFVCRKGLLHRLCLAHAMSSAEWVWIPYDAGQALHPACMEVVPTPSGEPPSQGCCGGCSVWFLHPSNTALEDQSGPGQIRSHRLPASASLVENCNLWMKQSGCSFDVAGWCENICPSETKTVQKISSRKIIHQTNHPGLWWENYVEICWNVFLSSSVDVQYILNGLQHQIPNSKPPICDE